MGIENFATFLVSSVIFAVTPGLDTVLVLNRSLLKGRSAGLWSTLGICAGVLVHTVFAAFGLSLLISQSETLFSAVKYAGTAYLLYIGVTKLLARDTGADASAASVTRFAESRYYYLLSGLTTNLLNPKVILFFLAFFPQFVARSHIDSPVPFLILGGTYAAVGLVWFAVISLFASSLSRFLLHNRSFKIWMDRISGAVFILMGVKIALTRR